MLPFFFDFSLEVVCAEGELAWRSCHEKNPREWTLNLFVGVVLFLTVVLICHASRRGVLAFKEDFCQCLIVDSKTNSFVSLLSTMVADMRPVSLLYQWVTFSTVIARPQNLVVLVNVK